MRLIPKLLLPALLVIVGPGIVASSSRAASTRDCNQKLENQAFDQPEPKDWASLYRLFKKFGVCDDGAIAEGFSEDVAQLFSKQWTHLNALSHLASTDKAFERFVLRHIDATLSEDELKIIAENSQMRCPAGEKRLCGLIRGRAQRSLDELSKFTK